PMPQPSSSGGFSDAAELLNFMLANVKAELVTSWQLQLTKPNGEVSISRFDAGTTAEEMLAAAPADSTISDIYLKTQERKSFGFAPTLNRSEVLDVLRDNKLSTDSDLNEIKKQLKKTCIPLRCAKDSDNIPGPDLDFVTTEPGKETILSSCDHVQPDKSQVWVLAGESGSGKSVLSCKLPEYLFPDGAILYATASSEAFAYRGNQSNAYVDFLKSLLEHLESKDLDLVGLISDMRTALQPKSPGVWQCCMTSWEKALPDKAQNWFTNPTGPKLDHLTLVLDEATDPVLARGMVDLGRTLQHHFLQHASRVQVVIAGTGLELLETLSGQAKFGTDPSKAKVIVVQSPNLTRVLDKISSQWTPQQRTDFTQALENGFFAKTLASNARMLFRGVLPVLSHRHHFCQPKDYPTTLSDRLQTIASHAHNMDYALRLYLTSNTVGTLGHKKRSTLLAKAFRFHLQKSRQSLETNEVWPPPVGQSNETDYEEIFTRGLAGRRMTSSALKLLSCYFQASELTPGGNAFEELCLCHILSQLRAEGMTAERIDGLSAGWPPPRSRANLSAAKSKLKKRPDPDKDFFKKLKTLSQDQPPVRAFVFRQLHPRAQGPDLFYLVKKDKGWELHAWQCKERSRNISEQDWKKWWLSLGVAWNETVGNGKNDESAKKKAQKKKNAENAKYSALGIQLLKEKLQGALNGSTVKLAGLAIATSLPGKDVMNLGVPQVADCACYIYPRECLQPTYEVCNPFEKKSSCRLPFESCFAECKCRAHQRPQKAMCPQVRVTSSKKHPKPRDAQGKGSFLFLHVCFYNQNVCGQSPQHRSWDGAYGSFLTARRGSFN
ncbi:unnamed protein product, partial [Symbiodinium microadriaticum]